MYVLNALLQRTLEKITHFENLFQSASILGTNQRTIRTLINISKCVMKLHQHFLIIKALNIYIYNNFWNKKF